MSGLEDRLVRHGCEMRCQANIGCKLEVWVDSGRKHTCVCPHQIFEINASESPRLLSMEPCGDGLPHPSNIRPATSFPIVHLVAPEQNL